MSIIEFALIISIHQGGTILVGYYDTREQCHAAATKATVQALSRAESPKPLEFGSAICIEVQHHGAMR